MEIGNNKENLTLKTAGKIKVLWGNKFIDLLDSNGNLNVKHQKILKSADSVDDITKDGIYIVDNKIVFSYDGNNIILENNNNSGESSDESEEESNDTEERLLKLEEIAEVYDFELMLDRLENIEWFLSRAYPLVLGADSKTYGFFYGQEEDEIPTYKYGNADLSTVFTDDADNYVKSGEDIVGYKDISIYPTAGNL